MASFNRIHVCTRSWLFLLTHARAHTRANVSHPSPKLMARDRFGYADRVDRFLGDDFIWLYSVGPRSSMERQRYQNGR